MGKKARYEIVNFTFGNICDAAGILPEEKNTKKSNLDSLTVWAPDLKISG
jgi:hypothetical protein